MDGLVFARNLGDDVMLDTSAYPHQNPSTKHSPMKDCFSHDLMLLLLLLLLGQDIKDRQQPRIVYLSHTSGGS
jgi:hypothetical protein